MLWRTVANPNAAHRARCRMTFRFAYGLPQIVHVKRLRHGWRTKAVPRDIARRQTSGTVIFPACIFVSAAGYNICVTSESAD